MRNSVSFCCLKVATAVSWCEHLDVPSKRAFTLLWSPCEAAAHTGLCFSAQTVRSLRWCLTIKKMSLYVVVFRQMEKIAGKTLNPLKPIKAVFTSDICILIMYLCTTGNILSVRFDLVGVKPPAADVCVVECLYLGVNLTNKEETLLLSRVNVFHREGFTAEMPSCRFCIKTSGVGFT